MKLNDSVIPEFITCYLPIAVLCFCGGGACFYVFSLFCAGKQKQTPENAMSTSTTKTKTKTNTTNKKRSKKKNFAVFVCGPDPHECKDGTPWNKNERGQHYIDLVSNAHHQQFENWSQFVVYKNDFPSPQEIDSFDAIIISGSCFDAHNRKLKWVQKLREIVLYVYETRREQTKLLGVCFGHQIIASALEGLSATGKNPKSRFDCSISEVRLLPAFFEYFDAGQYPLLRRLLLNMNRGKQNIARVAEAHGDAVLRLPKKAVCLSTSTKTEYEMYAIGQHVLCIQGHPEWSPTYACKMMDESLVYCRFSDEVFLLPYWEARDTFNNPANYEMWKYLFRIWINS